MAKSDAYVISQEEGFMQIEYRRNPTGKEMLEQAARLDEMEDSARRLYVMIDADILLSTAEVKEGAEFGKSMKNQPERIAVVAAGDITYGISRIFKVFRESADTRLQVFRELEAAKEWLLSDDQT
jgi:hypothetical protein